MELVYGESATIAAILASAALLMVPAIGFTLRYTVPPILEAVAKTRAIRIRVADRDGRSATGGIPLGGAPDAHGSTRARSGGDAAVPATSG